MSEEEKNEKAKYDSKRKRSTSLRERENISNLKKKTFNKRKMRNVKKKLKIKRKVKMSAPSQSRLRCDFASMEEANTLLF